MKAPLIIRNFFRLGEQKEVVSILRRIKYRPCPSFLGHFEYSKWISLNYLESDLADVILRLTEIIPGQTFNTVFIQRYLDHSFVMRHRDPLNNLDKTVVAVFGQFTGAISDYDGFQYSAKSGDVIIQDCTINNVQGLPHSVSAIVGERYALILNTIQYHDVRDQFYGFGGRCVIQRQEER